MASASTRALLSEHSTPVYHTLSFAFGLQPNKRTLETQKRRCLRGSVLHPNFGNFIKVRRKRPGRRMVFFQPSTKSRRILLQPHQAVFRRYPSLKHLSNSQSAYQSGFERQRYVQCLHYDSLNILSRLGI